jgi:hypothetical protein
MNVNTKKSMASAAVLIVLGIASLFAGAKSLVLLVPIAILVWYEARPDTRVDRD